MLAAGGFCHGMLGGWVILGTAGRTMRSLGAVAAWAAGAAILLRIYPALSPVPLMAGAGAGLVAHAVLLAWAIKGGRA